MVRGSAPHTLWAIASTLVSINVASASLIRAQMVVIPAGSIGEPNTTVSCAQRRHGAAHRPGIVFVDQLVDGLFGFLRRQRPPPGHPGGQLGVHRGHRRGVFDQSRAGDDGAHQQVAEQPGGEQRRHLGQPVAQRQTAVGLMQRHAGADVDRCGQLGGHCGLRVDPPQLALLGGGQPGAAVEELGHHRQLVGGGRVLRACPPAGGVDQLGVSQRRQVRDLRQRTIEHAFEPTGGRRRSGREKTMVSLNLCMNPATVDNLLSLI